jgi:hypothetical protein
VNFTLYARNRKTYYPAPRYDSDIGQEKQTLEQRKPLIARLYKLIGFCFHVHPALRSLLHKNDRLIPLNMGTAMGTAEPLNDTKS